MPPSTPASATSRHRPPSPSVSVVIPVRDGGGLPLVLRALPPVAEVIVVADPAAGEEIAAVRTARPDALVLRPAREGVGAALSTGIAAASGEVVVTLNGDGSTDPGEIPRYVGALVGGADVALGSRYSAGGRDLTGGRFRRWANQILIFLVNALAGTRRTDPGFGYAAFWRDTVPRLDLPDPSPRATAGWGDGPEIGPLLSLRPAARGLTVTEVGSIAYPRMRRGTRADRPGLRHWLAAALRERRTRPTGRHGLAAPETLVPRKKRPGRAPEAPVSRKQGQGRWGDATETPVSWEQRQDRSGGEAEHPVSWEQQQDRSGGEAEHPVSWEQQQDRSGGEAEHPVSSKQGQSRWGGEAEAPVSRKQRWAGRGEAQADLSATQAGPGATQAGPSAAQAGPSATQAGPGAARNRPGGSAETPVSWEQGPAAADGPGVAVVPGRDGVVWPQADRKPAEPIWSPARRRSAPPPWWAAAPEQMLANDRPEPPRPGHPERSAGPDVRPRPSWDHVTVPSVPFKPRREVGSRRRRLEGYRQRPELRLINGEGAGGKGRGGRLWAVPRNKKSN